MSTSIRLAVIGPQPPPAGGMARQTEQLVTLWRQQGYEVIFIPTNRSYRPKWLADIRGVRALARLVPYCVALWRAAGEVQLFHIMANSGWSWYLFAVPAIHIARMRSTAVVVNYRGGEAEQFLQQAVRRVKISLERAQALVVPSGYLRQVFQQFDIETTVVPNIIDLDRFVYKPQKAIPTAANESIELFFPRHLEYIYGADLAIQAVAQLSSRYANLTLKLAGIGPERGRLEQMAQQLQIADRVQFLGSMSPDEMVAAYHSAHMVVNPTRVDNMPNALIESLACGTPVLACRVGGVPFMLTHGEQALLVTAENVDELREAIDNLIRQPELYERLRQQGRQTVEQWGWQAVQALWLQVYQKALAEN